MSHDDCLVLLPLVAQAKNNVVNTRNANRISDTLNWEVAIFSWFPANKIENRIGWEVHKSKNVANNKTSSLIETNGLSLFLNNNEAPYLLF